MMKKGVVLTIGLLLIAGTAFATVYEFFTAEQVSLRIKGINPELESIVADEYTDWTHLGYNILDIEGYRLYTNLSNYSRVEQDQAGNEVALSGASGVDQWMIGGVAPIIGEHKAGLIYGIDSEQTADAIEIDDAGTGLGEAGSFEQTTTIPAADSKQTVEGEAKTEAATTTMLLVYALPLTDQVGIPLKVNLSILQDNMEELETNDYSMTDDDDTTGATDNIQKNSFSQEEKGVIDLTLNTLDFDEANTVIGINGSIEATDKLTIGLCLASKSSTLEYGNTYTYKQHESALHGATADDNTTKDSLDLSIDASGSAFGPAIIQADYELSDTIMLRGGIDISALSVSGDGEYTLKNEVIVGPLAGTGDDATLAKTSASSDIDGDENTTGFFVGMENQLSEKLMLGLGLRYQTHSSEFTMDWSGKETDESGAVTSYGANPMAELNFPVAVAGHDVKLVTSEDTTEVMFPIGLEYQATKALALRLGATHTITTTENEMKTDVVMYDDAALPTKTKLTSQSIVDADETINRATDFYYGAGINVSDNLVVDITTLVAGAGESLLDLDDWRISATLKF